MLYYIGILDTFLRHNMIEKRGWNSKLYKLCQILILYIQHFVIVFYNNKKIYCQVFDEYAYDF